MTNILKVLIGIILIIIAQTSVLNKTLTPPLTVAGIVLLVNVLIIDLGTFIYYNWNRVNLIVRCKILALKNEYIRFSMSYQYIIKVKDKYLLVKNSNWPFYQSVGGKYKRFSISENVIRQLEGRDDLKMETTGLKKDDFAVYIPAKNAIRFLDWFNKGVQRETGQFREFYEELIEGKAKILSKDTFPYINYEFLQTIRTPLRKSPNLKCWEILQYDILKLLPTNQQQKELEKLLEKGDTNYIKWADYNLIQNDGHNIHTKKTEYRIGEHTKWIVNQKWSKN